jgi:hypothetical protein
VHVRVHTGPSSDDYQAKLYADYGHIMIGVPLSINDQKSRAAATDGKSVLSPNTNFVHHNRHGRCLGKLSLYDWAATNGAIHVVY